MKDDTPALSIKQKDLDKNSQAFSRLVSRLTKVYTVLDVRYGLGGWAKILHHIQPEAEIHGLESDTATFNSAIKFGNVVCGRFPEDLPGEWPDQFDLVIADFNVVTSLNRELVDELLTIVSPKYLIFTDVACSKLHLNFQSYGLKVPDLDLYWKSFNLCGFRLLGWERAHHYASSALYRRNKKPRSYAGC